MPLDTLPMFGQERQIPTRPETRVDAGATCCKGTGAVIEVACSRKLKGNLWQLMSHKEPLWEGSKETKPTSLGEAPKNPLGPIKKTPQQQFPKYFPCHHQTAPRPRTVPSPPGTAHTPRWSTSLGFFIAIQPPR